MEAIKKFLNGSSSVYWVLGFHFVLWLGVSLALDIHPDMADHWVWSRFLAFGYYEHPPMVALTMKPVALFSEHTQIALKTGAVLFSVIILFLAFKTGVLFFNRATALIFVLILEVAPYFSAGSVFWHIDQPYMVCWLSGLYVIGRYIKTRNINWILIFGVIAGLGGMSKYIMILFPVCLLIWGLLNKAGRKLLLSPTAYLAALIALLIILPNIYWNYRNEWTTFIFVLEKGLTGATFGKHFLNLTLSQLFLFSIVYTCYFWTKFFKGEINKGPEKNAAILSSPKLSFLLITGLVPVVFFSLTSFGGSRTDPHWLNTGYFSLFLLLAQFIDREIHRGKLKVQLKIFATAACLNWILATAALIQAHWAPFPIPLSGGTSLNSVVAWDQTGRKIEELIRLKKLPIPPFVISREYQLAAGLALYMDSRPLPHSIEKALRNQWSPPDKVKQKGAFLACVPKECRKTIKKAEERFAAGFNYLGDIDADHLGRTVRRLKVFHLSPQVEP